MTTVKILCGGYGLRVVSLMGVSTRLVTMGETCEVDREEAERLAFLGLAEIVGEEAVATPADGAEAPGTSGDMPYEDGAQSGDMTATLDPDQLDTLTVAQLRTLAADMGLDASGCKRKAELVKLISAAPVAPGPDEAVEDGETPPALNAEAPVG